MITFNQFKTEYRKKEVLEGVKQQVVNGQIVPQERVSDEELRDMYNSLQNDSKTGLEHHGEVIAGDNGVLTLKSIGM
jgi:hypothetical protein